MEKLEIVICASKDHFGAFAENCEGIYAAGNTVDEVREDIEEAIRLIKKNLPEEQCPEILKGEYEIVYRYDTQSLLNYYSGILTNAALERLTGINKKQLWNYANGISKPRPTQVKRIETALHKLGQELIALSL